MTEQLHHDSFTLEKTYDAPRDRVWAAWTVAAQKQAWFGGVGEYALDVRPGGEERLVFIDQMGTHENQSRYFEVVEGERLVYAYSMALEGRVHTVSLATVLFADAGSGTTLTFTEQMCVIPPSDGKPGREHGWGFLLDALGRHLAGG